MERFVSEVDCFLIQSSQKIPNFSQLVATHENITHWSSQAFNGMLKKCQSIEDRLSVLKSIGLIGDSIKAITYFKDKEDELNKYFSDLIISPELLPRLFEPGFILFAPPVVEHFTLNKTTLFALIEFLSKLLPIELSPLICALDKRTVLGKIISYNSGLFNGETSSWQKLADIFVEKVNQLARSQSAKSLPLTHLIPLSIQQRIYKYHRSFVMNTPMMITDPDILKPGYTAFTVGGLQRQLQALLPTKLKVVKPQKSLKALEVSKNLKLGNGKAFFPAGRPLSNSRLFVNFLQGEKISKQKKNAVKNEIDLKQWAQLWESQLKGLREQRLTTSENFTIDKKYVESVRKQIETTIKTLSNLKSPNRPVKVFFAEHPNLFVNYLRFYSGVSGDFRILINAFFGASLVSRILNHIDPTVARNCYNTIVVGMINHAKHNADLKKYLLTCSVEEGSLLQHFIDKKVSPHYRLYIACLRKNTECIDDLLQQGTLTTEEKYACEHENTKQKLVEYILKLAEILDGPNIIFTALNHNTKLGKMIFQQRRAVKKTLTTSADNLINALMDNYDMSDYQQEIQQLDSAVQRAIQDGLNKDLDNNEQLLETFG